MATPVTVIYHADCLDGFGAAYAAWRRFGDAARYLPLHHGEPWALDSIVGHDVLILDFSFPEDTLVSMAQVARRVIQLDHHASAMRPFAGRLAADVSGNQIFQHPKLPLRVEFNLDNSGAHIAWRHFHPEAPVPTGIRLIEDLDLWAFKLVDSRAFCRVLRLQAFEFPVWETLMRAADDPCGAPYRQLILEGQAIENFFQREVERLATGHLTTPARLRGEPIDALQAIRHGQALITDGTNHWHALPALAVNANALFASELGNRLAEMGKIGLVWQLAADGEIKVSLRSQGSMDVSLIAARYGGGGHRNAAGFRLSPDRFFREVLMRDAPNTTSNSP